MNSIPQAYPERTKALPSVQPSTFERIRNYLHSVFAPVAESKVADLSISRAIRDEIEAFDIAAIHNLISKIAFDPETMTASFEPCKEIILLRPLRNGGFKFKIDASAIISIKHDHVGEIERHALQLGGIVHPDRTIAWNHIAIRRPA